MPLRLLASPPLRRRTAPVLALILLVGWVAGLGAPPVARADTASPGIAIEGWFARNKPRAPQVPTPAGPVSPGEVPAPQSPDTGAYVVSGAVAAGADQGDTGWAAYQWDLLAHLGATVNRFEAVLTQAPDNQGDHGTPVIQGCNIVEPFGAAPGANPWEDRPTVSCSTAVVPTAGTDDEGRATYTFDLTEMAQGWLDGDGFGVAIVPGTPEQESGFPPFQLTLAGDASQADEAAAVRPEVTFEFTPILGGGFGDGGGFDSAAGGAGGGGQAPPVEPPPDLDSFPDAGNEPPPPADVPEGDGGQAAPPPADLGPTEPVDRSVPFPWYGWLLVPVGLAALFVAGTVLGPAGDPVAARQGGVSRLLAQRRASGGGRAAVTSEGG